MSSKEAMNARPIITEEPVQHCCQRTSCDKCPKLSNKGPGMTIRLLNEIRKFCDTCGDLDGCANAKSAGAMTSCQRVIEHRAALMERAGVS